MGRKDVYKRQSYNVGNVAKNAMQYETLGEARKRELLQYLAEYLIEESELHGRALPPVAAEVVRDGLTSAAAEKLWLAFRSLANVRPSWPAPAEFLAAQDELLQGLIAEAGKMCIRDRVCSCSCWTPRPGCTTRCGSSILL